MRYLIIFLFSFSCSSYQQNKNISSTVQLKNNEKNIVIDSNVEVPSRKVEKVEVKVPNVGIFLYPTLYTSLAVVELLRQLEAVHIKVNTISSFGYGAVIAALYAKEGTTSYLEWKIFALLRKLEGYTPYTKEWEKVILNFIELEFKNLKVNELKLSLVIPGIKSNPDRSITVADVLKSTLDIANKNHFITSKDFYFNIDSIIKTDIQFNIMFLPKEIGFEKLSSFNYGVYTYYLGQVMDKDFIKIVHAESEIKLDKIYSSSDIYTLFFSNIVILRDHIEEDVSSWREDNSSSLLNYNN